MLTFNTPTKSSTDKKTNSMSYKLIVVSLLSLGLFACDDDSPDKVMEYSYSVTLTNLTYAQPLSPVALSLHGEEKMWQVGESASTALEKLSEGGDNTDFMALANNIVSVSSEEPVPPGDSVTLNIKTTDASATYFTVATMLVNTNDAFSGLTGVDISTLAVEQAQSWHLSVYDAGTESNSEVAGTIPGPADGGVGFDEVRDDINLVAYHAGVVSKNDGLSNSVLTQAHRFDNPAIKLTITRTK